MDIGFLLGDFVAGTAAIFLVERYDQFHDTKIVRGGSAIAAAALVNYLWMGTSVEITLLHAVVAGLVALWSYPYVFQWIYNKL